MRLLLQIFTILSIALVVSIPVFAGEIDDLKIEIGDREKEIQELQQKASGYKGVVSQKHEEADTLSGAISDFNQQIRSLENDIAIKRKEISSIRLHIRRTELEIQAKKESIQRTKQYISAVLREIYETDDKKIVELVLKYENFSEFFNQVEYVGFLQNDLKARLDEITEIKTKLESNKEELDSKHSELENFKKDLENRNQILASQKFQKKNLLEETRSAEWRYKNLLRDALSKKEEIQQEIFELEDQLRRAIDPRSVPKAIPGVLSWPTEGIFTQGYGCLKTSFARRAYPACDEGRGGFHNGLDIASGLGTPIVAARNGAVMAIENSPWAYGKWVAIEHDNGLITVYPHLSLQSVSIGQIVKRGELVGYMGSSGFSTGSHLHFMVYAPNTFSTKPSKIAGILPIGATLNPRDYLP